ncbi:acetate/propionate family kinase [Dyadobacter luticola]|uniref:Acetate kinase n=1 Tax=Dyadobacter luticola TaxID=1979387 RepID=A0A5R9L1K9_9BACT|nr:acetate/propionate family kinase [Dyadobacter luticola]TLV02413.1 acetate/propionate family kinase [Dyadobacter luticola]
MKQSASYILSLNCGSSSIKFCVFSASDLSQCLVKGTIGNIGPGTSSMKTAGGNIRSLDVADVYEAGQFLMDWLESQLNFTDVVAVGHRIVHGMNHTDTEIISESTLMALQNATAVDPDHLPGALALIKIIGSKYPNLRQVACYDTAFHKDLPQVARTFALPQTLANNGIIRYGFHGLSYSYLIEKLKKEIGTNGASGRLVLMHLGSGASLAAVCGGKSVDTTMGFTPTGGVMMGTRSGDLDPGIILYLMLKEGLDISQLNKLLNKESGLLGVSGQTSDMQKLLALEKTDARASEAVEMFCYQVKKALCAYIGILGGIDAVVFTGGIGENLPEIRARICAQLEFFGIQLDEKKNASGEFLVSTTNQTPVYVIKTDEEYMIALLTRRCIEK